MAKVFLFLLLVTSNAHAGSYPVCEQTWDCPSCEDKYILACATFQGDRNEIYNALVDCIRHAKDAAKEGVSAKCEQSRTSPTKNTNLPNNESTRASGGQPGHIPDGVSDKKSTISAAVESACMSLYTLAKREDTQSNDSNYLSEESYAQTCKTSAASCLPTPKSAFKKGLEWLKPNRRDFSTDNWMNTCEVHAKAFKTKPADFWKADRFYGAKLSRCKDDLDKSLRDYANQNQFKLEDYPSFDKCQAKDATGAVIYSPKASDTLSVPTAPQSRGD